jgi:hypothetical protein
VVVKAYLDGQFATYTLESGAEVTADLTATDGSAMLEPGVVLFYAASNPPLYAGAAPSPPGLFDRDDCFVKGGAARDEGATNCVCSGLHLPKADDFRGTKG